MQEHKRFGFLSQIEFVEDFAHKVDSDPMELFPSYDQELMQAIEENQILIIVGDVSSGIETQLPKLLLLEDEYAEAGKIVCTQPHWAAAVSCATVVSEDMDVELGDNVVGYRIPFCDCSSEETILNYMTDGMLLEKFLSDGDLSSYSVIMVGRAHERTLSTDILLALLKMLVRRRPELKLVITSATGGDKLINYFGHAQIFDIPVRPHRVSIYHQKAPQADYIDAIVVTTLQIHVTQPPGDILIFLMQEDDIETVEEILNHRSRILAMSHKLIIHPMYACVPTALKPQILEPTLRGARIVYLVTNAAEISIKMTDIKYVIDPGTIMVRAYNPLNRMELLKVTHISKAIAMERAYLAGQTGQGKCYRLYTASTYEGWKADTVPEVQHANLSYVVLLLKSLLFDDLKSFDYIESPPDEAISKAVALLCSLEALNQNARMTLVGFMMVAFPVDPMVFRMIVSSGKYGCSDEIITIAAMLSVRDSIFNCSKYKKVHEARFCLGNVGDHVGLLKVYNDWKSHDYASSWCHKNNVQAESIVFARSIRTQLEKLLKSLNIKITSSDGDLEAVKKAITSGFFPNSAILKSFSARPQKYISYLTNDEEFPEEVYLHPSSSLAQIESPPRLVVYHEMISTTNKYIRQVTEVKVECLLEIAPHHRAMLENIEHLQDHSVDRKRSLDCFDDRKGKLPKLG